MLGSIGKLLILTAFVACALSGFAFFRAAQLKEGTSDWKRIGRAAWGVMLVAVLSAFGLLIYLSVTHQFQYAYIYQYTSMDLPLSYLVSASWAGQEGSFLLWIIMNSLVGIALIKWASSYEAPTMAIVAFCQIFLMSMIVGLNIGSLPIGSSPFMLLIEKYPEAPMLQAGIVPNDGQGLNDLLQNYWMVIHPPVLFLGFASMIVPFAFAVTALWKRQYTAWVRPALPWALFAVMALGIGVAMGGYWAYETLSFGGYWAWDPVENSSLVPWLIGIAAIHTMIVQKRSGHSHKASIFLSILAYMLIIYSTFLTRSGILGETSVHSFVDLGLYNQLLLWILSIGIVGFGLFIYRYRELPTPTREPDMLSREFMIFAGAMLLCAVAAVILLGTSTPILGHIFRDSPSTVPIEFYNKWSLPLTVGLVFLAGLGQLFWWNKMSVENINKVLLKPIALSVVSTIIVLVMTPFVEHSMRAVTPVLAADAPVTQAGFMSGLTHFWGAYGMGLLLLLLVFVAFFALYGNGMVLWRIARGNPRMAGGAISHVGFAILILGIVASSGFSNPLARNTGVQIGESRNNFILERGQPRTVDGYRVSYTGQGQNAEGRTTYLLDFVDPNGRAFSLKPVVYKSTKDQWIQHPDLKTFPEKDLYVAVTPNLMFNTPQSGQEGEVSLLRGDSTVVGDNAFLIHFVDFDMNVDEDFVTDSTQIAVGARLAITNLQTNETRNLRPVYLVMEDRSVQYMQNRVEDWALTVSFTGMNVNTGAITLGLEGVEVAPEDWLVVQAYEKPFINFVWFGIIMVSIGFGVSIYRRAYDQRASYRRGTA